MRMSALIAVGLFLALAAPLASPAGAQTPAPAASPDSGLDALPQMPLTDALIRKYIAAQGDIAAVIGSIDGAADKPDPKILARLEAAARAHDFANYDEFDTLAGNIALVLDGVDTTTKTYIGTEAALKQQIAAVQADAKMSADERAQALDELKAELQNVTPIKFPGNVAIVMKYYDQFAAADASRP